MIQKLHLKKIAIEKGNLSDRDLKLMHDYFNEILFSYISNIWTYSEFITETKRKKKKQR